MRRAKIAARGVGLWTISIECVRLGMRSWVVCREMLPSWGVVDWKALVLILRRQEFPSGLTYCWSPTVQATRPKIFL